MREHWYECRGVRDAFYFSQFCCIQTTLELCSVSHDCVQLCMYSMIQSYLRLCHEWMSDQVFLFFLLKIIFVVMFCVFDAVKIRTKKQPFWWSQFLWVNVRIYRIFIIFFTFNSNFVCWPFLCDKKGVCERERITCLWKVGRMYCVQNFIPIVTIWCGYYLSGS